MESGANNLYRPVEPYFSSKLPTRQLAYSVDSELLISTSDVPSATIPPPLLILDEVVLSAVAIASIGFPV